MPLREYESGSYKQYSAQSRSGCHILQWVIAYDLDKREIRMFYVTRWAKQGDMVSSPNALGGVDEPEPRKQGLRMA